jgi:hypothetical protein
MRVPGRRTAANLLTRDKARRIAANIARLPELLSADRRRTQTRLFTGGRLSPAGLSPAKHGGVPIRRLQTMSFHLAEGV